MISTKFTLRGDPTLTQVFVTASLHSASGMKPLGQSPASLSSGVATAASAAAGSAAATEASAAPVFSAATAAPSATKK
jgi:hypothetical protein